MPAAPWVTITDAELMDSMTEKERLLYGKVAAAETRPDRVPGILADLIAEIRGYIVTWSQNTVSADPTKIPQSFRARALALARWRVLISLPNYDPNPARKDEWEKAEEFFKRVADGKIRPEPADDAKPNTVPSENVAPAPMIRSRERLFTRRNQDGI